MNNCDGGGAEEIVFSEHPWSLPFLRHLDVNEIQIEPIYNTRNSLKSSSH